MQLLGRTIQADAARKDLVDALSSKLGASKRAVMQQIGMPASVYYYRPRTGRKGCLPSKQTWHQEQGWVDNPVVIVVIADILSRPFYDYCPASRRGYHNITAEYREMGYRIKHKKVYRLKKKARLLVPVYDPMEWCESLSSTAKWRPLVRWNV